jgi:hypothetical protein
LPQPKPISEGKKEAYAQRSLTYSKFGIDKIFKNIEEMYDQRRTEDLINISSKTKFLFELLKKMKSEGRRVLVFSMSK